MREACWVKPHFVAETDAIKSDSRLKRQDDLSFICAVDKLLSNEDGGGIFDDPPAIAESVMMPQDHGDDDDDFDALSGCLNLNVKLPFRLTCNSKGKHFKCQLFNLE